jgi:hypothetical protein
MSLFFVDVEATNLSPFSGVMTEFGAVEYDSRASFHGVLWDAEPDPDVPAKPLVTLDSKHYDEKSVMEKFATWIKQTSKGRPIFVSDNNGYDSQWINFYFDKHLGVNPFGHSSRRISDFWAGLQSDFYNTQKWKQYRVTEHDHNPVNDSLGNVEAFHKIMELIKK